MSKREEAKKEVKTEAPKKEESKKEAPKQDTRRQEQDRRETREEEAPVNNRNSVKEIRTEDQAKKENILVSSGILGAYEYFLKQICKHGLPTGNVYEYAALQVQKYERKLRAEQLKKRQAERLREEQLRKEEKEREEKKKRETSQHREYVSPIRELLKDEKTMKKIVKDSFEAVDRDKSGWISAKELENAMKLVAANSRTAPPSAEDVKGVMASLDKNKDGKISISEFEVLVRQTLQLIANAEEQANRGKKNLRLEESKREDPKTKGKKEERKENPNQPYVSPLRAMLKDNNAVKKLTKESFDSVDKDKSGSISLKELENAMKAVAAGSRSPPPNAKDIETLMAGLDKNKDGKLSLAEFETLVRQMIGMMAAAEEDSYQRKQKAEELNKSKSKDAPRAEAAPPPKKAK